MKSTRLTFTFIGIFFFFISLSAENDFKISFDNFPFINQLPSNSIYRIYQDKEGYMWFGTMEGLCRYDAYEIKIFRSDHKNPHLLTNNDILCMTEDFDDQLWIGTREGVNIMDKKTLAIRPLDNEIINSVFINSLLCDSTGNIWIGTQSGLFKHEYQSGQIIYFSDETQQPVNQLPSYGINHLYEDTYKNIWISTWQNGLYKYNPGSGTFTKYPPVGNENNPFRLFQDKDNNYWICTWGDGFYAFDPTQPAPLMYKKIKIEGSAEDAKFFSIVQDDTYGYFWLMSWEELLVLEIDGEGRTYKKDISSFLQTTNKIFSEIIKDDQGRLWIGAYSEGAFIISFEAPEVLFYPLESLRQKLGSFPRIVSIMEDSDGLIWLGLDRIGLCFFDKETNSSFIARDFNDMGYEPNQSRTINTITEIKGKQEYWVGYDTDFIHAFKKNNGRIYMDRKIDMSAYFSAHWNSVKKIFEDNNGNVWIGMENGLYLVSTDNRILELSRTGTVMDIAQDIYGNVWIATRKNGVQIYTPVISNELYKKKDQWDSRNQLIGTNDFQALCSHQEGNNIWIATKDGRVLVYSTSQHELKDLTVQCGLSGELILNIIPDNNQNIWISTSKRIIKFNPYLEIPVYYVANEELDVTSFLQGACFKNNSGDIYFGGNKGFCVFLPEENEPLKKTRTNNQVVITDIKLHNVSVFDTPSKLNTGYPDLLIINPNDDNLEISFSSLNYSNPTKIRYAYKMEGVDNEWIYLKDNRRFATYNKLKKGDYIFHVKCTDENGIWSSQVTSFRIYKKPALYETWWAYLLYILAFILLFLLIQRFFLNRMKLKNQLEIANIDKQKSEELTQIKLRYFTNISHELLTPLTIISCTLDEMKKNKETSIIKSNITRLKRLLQQILDFRKMESGNMQLKVNEGDISGFIKEICFSNFAPLIKSKKIDFRFEPLDNPVRCFFDADKIDKIIFNLLSNAFKYTGSKGKIHVFIEKTKKKTQDIIKIIVSDTGKGIDPEYLPEIFKRFSSNQLDSRTESNGIGLSLTRELVELHHGTIQVESQPGIGTTFIIEFPASKSSYSENEIDKGNNAILPDMNPDVMEETEEYEEGDTTEKNKKEDIHVLVVEDNEQLRELITGILDKKYITYAAENGVEALKIIEEHEIDIVVSDIVMPEMDGLELCKRIKKDISTSHIEVLLLTAKNNIEDRISSYNAGADGYLAKPFDLRVLKAKIGSLIKNRKSRNSEFKNDKEINISGMNYVSMDEVFMQEAIKAIKIHLSDSDYSLEKFAAEMNMSKASLYRKVKSLTGLSPVEFIRNIRLKHACIMLKKQTENIAGIAYSVGFSDPKYFRECFKKMFGVTPSEYMKMNRTEDNPDPGDKE